MLDEDGDEVLINPNLIENEMHKRNVELRKKTGSYKPYEEEVDEYGMSKKQQILAKYDEGLDGSKERETFRLGMISFLVHLFVFNFRCLTPYVIFL